MQQLIRANRISLQPNHQQQTKPAWSSAFNSAPNTSIVTKKHVISLPRPHPPSLQVPDAVVGVKLEDNNHDMKKIERKGGGEGDVLGDVKSGVTAASYDSSYVFSSASEVYDTPAHERPSFFNSTIIIIIIIIIVSSSSISTHSFLNKYKS
jgi:hypothetical protein